METGSVILKVADEDKRENSGNGPESGKVGTHLTPANMDYQGKYNFLI